MDAENTAEGITQIGKATCTVSNGSSGVTIKWNKVKDANGYYIYRDYDECKKITGNSTFSFIDKKVSNGSEYEYYVVAYGSDGLRGASSADKMIVYLSKPTLSSVTMLQPVLCF